jgi:putative oxygen-independent coproporphyrinogen III oxidase
VRATPTITAPPANSLRFASLPPLSLYVHLPWCVRKCPYCDFNSYQAPGSPDALPHDAYVDALLRDFDAELAWVHERPLQSVFIGGGTPSLFPGVAVRRLLDGLRARSPLAADAEITLEANPGAVEARRFAEYRDAGVNRLSIGIQSFRDAQLARLGRVHSAEEGLRAFVLARAAGFENVNLDLMYALPGDDTAGSLSDLGAAMELVPEHLSWYQLTLEPNTAFHRRPPSLPAEESVAEIEAEGRALLAQSGYARYEISAYARPKRRCAHNLNYWEFGDYLGIGAGAHGKVTLRVEGAILRRAKQRNPGRYVAEAGTSAAVSEERIVAADQAALECLMNALRLPEGFSVALYEQRAGQPLCWIREPLAQAEERGWMHREARLLQPTAAGLQMLNGLLALFC